MSGQRTDFLSWDEFFMSIVCLAAIKGRYWQEGACIVDRNNKILSIGTNDIPYPIQNEVCSGAHDFCTDPVFNALYTFKGNRKEFEQGTIFLSKFPNKEDAQKIAQAKFARVVYLSKSGSSTQALDPSEELISRKILEVANVKIESYFEEEDFISYNEFLTQLKRLFKKNIGQENGVLTEKEYFMGIAILSSLRSKDPSTQVGACLVDEDGRILSVGYNGAPFGMSDDVLPWHSNGEENDDLVNIKNSYVIHAEANTLDNYRGQQDDLKGKKMFLTLSPCYKCTQRLSMISLSEIIWLVNYEKMIDNYGCWFKKTDTGYQNYFNNDKYTKDMYRRFVSELTVLIKEYLGKEEYKQLELNIDTMPKMLKKYNEA